ncbi:hypothetical protein K435DRAFT_868810 [Dendrothele bispora CBS 962.96]|uniref:MULE transposase domain-containing protein n=1 Tax=Dendrothele bispora (strain CBS 962.96) TaxID=1314807 RepID=A0A4S8LB72_DENBC|nr:hypothetical protein K435DRAFT_868810 [Dendrothele bispora CBS 962.96]
MVKPWLAKKLKRQQITRHNQYHDKGTIPSVKRQRKESPQAGTSGLVQLPKGQKRKQSDNETLFRTPAKKKEAEGKDRDKADSASVSDSNVNTTSRQARALALANLVRKQAGRPSRSRAKVSPSKRAGAGSPQELKTLHREIDTPTLTPPTTPRSLLKSSPSVFLSPRLSRAFRFTFTVNDALGTPSIRGSPGRQNARMNNAIFAQSRTLSTLPHRRPEWIKEGSVNTVAMYKVFDEMSYKHNDYTPHEYNLAKDLVAIRFVGHPLDRPKDIRSRPFYLEWVTPDGQPPPTLLKQKRVVMRVTYECLGYEEDSSINLNLDDENESSKEVENARNSTIKKTTERSRELTQLYEKENFPDHHKPKAAQIDSMVANARKHERLESDPLRAIQVFAKHNPDLVFCYEYEPSLPKPRFQLGIKNPYCLQVLLLYGCRYGLGFDSSYRNKNENRAPLTFLTTVDDNQRMLPGPVFLSGDVTSETLTTFLSEVKILVEKMAKMIAKDHSVIDSAINQFESDLVREAKHVRKKKQWRPLFLMIDKCRPEVNAIRAVWPDMCIRLCQFHAILRWDSDITGEAAQARPHLSNRQKYLLLWAFRNLQRARTQEEFGSQHVTFIQLLARITQDNRDLYYSSKIEMWTDIGLPAGESRDQISTNNFTERAFKLFDDIFLQGWANKS